MASAIIQEFKEEPSGSGKQQQQHQVSVVMDAPMQVMVTDTTLSDFIFHKFKVKIQSLDKMQLLFRSSQRLA